MMMRDSYAQRQQNPPLLESMEIVVALSLMAICWFAWYVARERFYFNNRQIAELACYLALAALAIIGSSILITTARSRRGTWWSPETGTSSLLPMPGSKTPWSSATTYMASRGIGRTECALCRASSWA